MMKLTFEQIRSVTFGALSVRAEHDGIHFDKCTPRQVAAWRALSEMLGLRAETTTGVRLDFHTDSRTLAFGAVAGNKYEVYVDGVLRKQFLCNALRESGETASMALTDPLGGARKTVRVTLYLPCHEIGVLDFVELDDGATLTPHAFDRKILFVGDSITQGCAATYDSLSFAQRTSRFFNAESVIQGIGGAYFHESTFDALGFDPDTVIVAYGINDFAKHPTLDVLRERASAYVRRVAEEYLPKKTQVYYISPIWSQKQEKPMGTLAQARAVLIEEAQRAGLRHIDGLSLMPPDLALYHDGLHPNNLGFSIYAERLCQALL